MAEHEITPNGNSNQTEMNPTTQDLASHTPMAPESSLAAASPMAKAIPTPPITPQGGPTASQPNHGITHPVAPEGGIGAAPSPKHGVTHPVAPEGGLPAAPSPSLPIPPSFPNVPSFPIPPSFPTFPSPQYFGQVRFLNASTNSFPVNISVDHTTYAVNSRFGTITNYDWISDGFHTVTVRRATGLRTVLIQQTFPFSSGEKVTIVLVDTASGGLNMVRVSDRGCSNLPYHAGCYRAANMSCSGSSYDIMLYGGETVFRSIGFQEVTPYKQAMNGSYQFYVNHSNRFSMIREIPIIVIGAYGTGSRDHNPLLSFQVDINAGQNYTTYLIGNTWSDYMLRAFTVED